MERDVRLNKMESLVQVLKILDECQSKFISDKDPYIAMYESDGLVDNIDKNFAMAMINECSEFCEKCESAKEIINQKLFELVD